MGIAKAYTEFWIAEKLKYKLKFKLDFFFFFLRYMYNVD